MSKPMQQSLLAKITPHDKGTVMRLSYMTAMVEHMMEIEPAGSCRGNLYKGIHEKIVKALEKIGINGFTGDDTDKAIRVFMATDKAIAKEYPVQCKAMSKKTGNRCRHNSLAGSDYCQYHKKI